MGGQTMLDDIKDAAIVRSWWFGQIVGHRWYCSRPGALHTSTASMRRATTTYSRLKTVNDYRYRSVSSTLSSVGDW